MFLFIIDILIKILYNIFYIVRIIMKKRNFYKFINELKNTSLDSLTNVILAGEDIPETIQNVLCISWLMSALLIFVIIPYNGIVVYTSLVSALNFPVFSNFTIGLFSSMMYLIIRNLTDNLESDTIYSYFMTKLIIFVIMSSVSVYFLICL